MLYCTIITHNICHLLLYSRVLIFSRLFLNTKKQKTFGLSDNGLLSKLITDNIALIVVDFGNPKNNLGCQQYFNSKMLIPWPSPLQGCNLLDCLCFFALILVFFSLFVASKTKTLNHAPQCCYPSSPWRTHSPALPVLLAGLLGRLHYKHPSLQPDCGWSPQWVRSLPVFGEASIYSMGRPAQCHLRALPWSCCDEH